MGFPIAERLGCTKPEIFGKVFVPTLSYGENYALALER